MDTMCQLILYTEGTDSIEIRIPDVSKTIVAMNQFNKKDNVSRYFMLYTIN